MAASTILRAASFVVAAVGMVLAIIGGWRGRRLDLDTLSHEFADYYGLGPNTRETFARQRQALILATAGAVLELGALILMALATYAV